MADLVQYILVRGDLKAFSAGALMAQAAHAATAALWASRDAPATLAYTASLERMHKVVLKGESEAALRAAAARLAAAGVAHHLWLELPEAVPTALATAPAPRDAVKPHFADFKLYR